jgi:hypothetical protein
MATLRIRFKLNPGGRGIALAKLGEQSKNIELFLRSLAGDLGESDGTQMWLATSFKEGSFITAAEYQAVVDVNQAVQFNNAMNSLTKFKTIEEIPPFLSPTTVDRFATLRTALDDGERIGVALFDPRTHKPGKFRFVDKLQLATIREAVNTEVTYFGCVMGTTYEWNKGAERPYLLVREALSGDLVKCTYRDSDYAKVSNIFSKRTAVVIIEGTVVFNRISGRSEVTEAVDFAFAPSFSNDDFDAFFGCASGLTGSIASEEVISEGRKWAGG